MTELVKARWVFPVDSDPIENGTIEFEDGMITAVHSSHVPGAKDLGNVAILPALINPHVHLEFSDLDKPISPALPFTDWIRSVIQFRNQENRSIPEAIHQGITESSEAGCALLGEIVTTDLLKESYLQDSGSSPVMKILFREIIGILPDQNQDCLNQIEEFLNHDIFQSGNNLFPAISPHAPYTVGWDLYCDLAKIAEKHDVPLAIHLAETKSELELLSSQTGEFREMLENFGLWSENLFSESRKPLDHLRQLKNVRNALVIHGNYLDEEELKYLSGQSNLTMVYCPRTHACFDHEKHPWQKVQTNGGRVALGTDGRSSNPDLELWKEVQFLAKKNSSSGVNDLLKLVTLNPAIALGKEKMLGSISLGKMARFFLIKLPDFDSSEIETLLYNEDNKCFTDLSPPSF